jgi:peptide chain release factor 2
MAHHDIWIAKLFILRAMVVDSDVDGVLNGDIDAFLKSFLMMMGQKEEK